MTRYTFQRGETITLALDIVDGVAGDVLAITGRIRRKVGGDESAELTVTERTSGGDMVGWLLTLVDSSDLPEGQYLVDAKLTFAGGSVITDPAEVRLDRAASSPA